MAFGRNSKEVDTAQQRTLAGAAGPQKDDYLRFVDRQINPLQNLTLAIGLFNAFQTDDFFTHFT